jgi:hypothetical protein
MAVYKIFPEKSATLYSFYPTTNTGLDEIIEISTFESINSTNEVSRGIIKFPTDQINDVITNKVGNRAFDTYLKLYLANASSIPVNYTLYCYPISGSWEKGTGRLANVPTTTDGASWSYRNQLNGIPWFSGQNFPTSATGSTTGSFRSGSTSGGGLWYTGSYEASQSFNTINSKDIEIKTTFIVNKWISSSIINEGFIIKHSNQTEFTTQSKFELKYFSENTHTIYPPCLEIRWNDFTYSTGSLPTITSDLIVASILNNKNEYQQDSVQRFKINVRDKYPARTFQTSSVYLNNKVLPTASYWSIKDLDTEEIIIDYDTTYTKISADSTGNYFDVYMNGLEPERYYKLLIKTIVGGTTTVLDNDYYFKVIR